MTITATTEADAVRTPDTDRRHLSTGSGDALGGYVDGEASPDQLAELRTRLELAAAALPGSPGAAYLERRRIPLELAARHGLGWATVGKLRGRVVFPLTNPEGVATSATGRAVDPDLESRYRALPAVDYPKGWFNAAAIAALNHPFG